MNGDVPRYWVNSVPALMPENIVRTRTSLAARRTGSSGSKASSLGATSARQLSCKAPSQGALPEKVATTVSVRKRDKIKAWIRAAIERSLT
jgi:hypothetical protein